MKHLLLTDYEAGLTCGDMGFFGPACALDELFRT